MARRPKDSDDETPRRVAVAMREESAPERWLRTLRLSGFGVIALVLLGVAVVVLAPSLRLLVEQQQQITALERQVAEQRADAAEIQSELDRWSDPAYVESQARERLLFVYPGEFVYLVTRGAEEQTPVADGLPISDELQTTQVDWIAAFVGAGLEAGLTVATAEELAPVGDAVDPAATTAPAAQEVAG